MAHDDELAEIARYDPRRRRNDGEGGRRSHRQQIPDPDCSPPAKSCPACRCSTPCRTAPSRSAIPRPIIISARTRPSPSARRCRSVPTARLNQAWYTLGGGKEVLNEFYKSYNVISLLAGNTGCQMGGWFRKEIKTVDDLKGLKFRIGGFAGRVMQKLGACRSRSPAATSIRRWKRARSTRPNGSVPTTTRSSASTRSRRTTTIPAGGKAARCCSPSSTSRSGTRCRRTIRACSSRPATSPTTG